MPASSLSKALQCAYHALQATSVLTQMAPPSLIVRAAPTPLARRPPAPSVLSTTSAMHSKPLLVTLLCSLLWVIISATGVQQATRAIRQPAL